MSAPNQESAILYATVNGWSAKQVEYPQFFRQIREIVNIDFRRPLNKKCNLS